MLQSYPHSDERYVRPTYLDHAWRSAALSLSAIAAASYISAYVSGIGAKALGFSAVVGAFLAGSLALFLHYRDDSNVDSVGGQSASTDIDNQLQILDDARQFFSGSLKVADTFRLVASRIRTLVEAGSVTLLLFDPKREELVVAGSDDPTAVKGETVSSNSGLVSRCYLERDVVVDKTTASAAVPLKRGTEVAGILLFYLNENHTCNRELNSLLDAIGERVGPLVFASVAYERSQADALTDVTTELPNERAFHLVLENQVAEAIRNAGSRPLTILSFNINGFDELNSRFGFVSSNRILNFVAESAKGNLRQMDFLARGDNDEFLAILPTASTETSHEIITRIQASVAHKKVTVSDVDSVEIEVAFGWASFGFDGDTPHDLLSAARERREQVGSPVPGTVLWFPQELSH